MVHLKKGAAGHLLKNAAGHLAKACGTAANCGYCNSGTTPYQYEIVFSGISVSLDCFEFTGHNWSQQITSAPEPNGTWILPQTGNPCAWRLTESGSFGTLNFCNTSTDCSSGCTNYPLITRDILLWKTSPTVWLLIFQYLPTGGLVPATIWYSTCCNGFPGVPSGDCGNFIQNHPCDAPGYDATCDIIIPASGGSATITPL